jgi:hypothetical protein
MLPADPPAHASVAAPVAIDSTATFTSSTSSTSTAQQVEATSLAPLTLTIYRGCRVTYRQEAGPRLEIEVLPSNDGFRVVSQNVSHSFLIILLPNMPFPCFSLFSLFSRCL